VKKFLISFAVSAAVGAGASWLYDKYGYKIAGELAAKLR